LQGSVIATLRLDRLARFFYQRSNSGFDFAIALLRYQALAMSLYRRSMDYQRNPSKKKVYSLVTSAVAGVNVDGNPSMNPRPLVLPAIVFTTDSTAPSKPIIVQP
jgi:hypothetical protein